MELESIKRKTVISTLSLFFQSGYSAFLGLAANLVITILLSPSIFGIYIATLSIISILNYFSDIGLAASLIQKKEVFPEDETTAFTVQQMLVLSLVIIGYSATSFIKAFYKLPPEATTLYWALLLGFFLSSLKTIPSVFLERKIKFERIVIVQLIENTSFYLTVIILAIAGFGLQSFTYAVLVRSVLGVIAMYWLSPWMPKIGLYKNSFKKLVSFGIPFQATSLLALVKDDLMTLFLGKILGFQILGYIGWAKKWAEAAIRIIMDNISRILFPLFSRFQTEKERLSRLLEKIVFYQSLLIIPAIFGVALTMSRFIEIIPKYSKWSPALPFFYLFCISALLSSYSTPFINFLNGIGKVRISFYFMVGWTIATWILAPVLIHFFGSIGFPITLVILSLSFFIVIAQTKKMIDFKMWKNVSPFLISSILMSICVTLIFKLPLGKIPVLLLAISTAIISYLFSLRYIFSVNVIHEIRNLLKNE